MEKGGVAIFVISNSLSGAEKRFIRIASQISKIRDDIILIVNNNLYRSALSDSELNDRIKVLENHNRIYVLNKEGRTLSKYFRIISNLLELFIVIKKRKIKILHSVLAALRYTIFKRLLNVKIIAEITSPDVSDRLLTNRYLKLSLDRFDKIITVSENVRNRTIKNFKKIKKHYLIDRIHCSSIPFFLPTNQHNSPNYEEKENLIVFASRFIERKNPILFAKAVQKLLDINKDWKVAVLGKGPLEEEIKRILKKYIEKERVVVEYTKDIYGYLKKSKIFVSLIYPDNYPSQSILEAMYMKNAIVATNVGYTHKFVTEYNGFLVDRFDVMCVYKVLLEAVSDEERLKQMGEISLKIINEKFSSRIYLEELGGLYDKMLRG